MNNGRDCEHGSQLGKCYICDLVEAENRIAELEKGQILSDCLVMANARALIKAKAITSNGRLYMQLFGTGLASAYAACRKLGLEPEDNKTSYNAMREHLDALASAED